MIKFSLTCASGHAFESWFQSGEAYDALHKRALVSCTSCGSSEISKTLMAPSVRPSRTGIVKPEASRPLAAPASGQEAALAQLRKQVEENSDYVGLNFAAEARAMHEGEAPSRAIYGEARLDEARSLIEDGVPVAPLPFRPTRQTN